MSEQGEREARCWNALLREVPCDQAESLPTLVCYRGDPDRGWSVHTRYRGEEVLEADGLSHGEAADLVMSVFGHILEENEAKGSRPLPA